MIQAVTTSEQHAAFLRRLADKPYYAAVLGTRLTLFGTHPATGWRFYLLPGTAALALRGGSAAVCGALPDKESCAELGDFLRFLGADRLLCEQTPPSGWRPAPPLSLWALARGQALPLPPAPEPAWNLTLAKTPAMRPVSRLVSADPDERDNFYADACAAIAHGVGACRALLDADGAPVCTVGCYARSAAEAYLSAGVTAPDWRGRGLAGWLIVTLANELAADRTARFACAPELDAFYTRLGFSRAGTLNQYTNPTNETESTP